MNNRANIPPAMINTLYKRFLAVEEPNLIHGVTATYQTLPKGGGLYMTWRRYEKFGLALDDLGITGQDPAPRDLEINDYSAQVKYYGLYANIQEQLEIQNQESVLNIFAERLGISMRESEDVLIRDRMATTMNVMNCTKGGNAQVPTEITRDDIVRMTQVLIRNSAKFISRGVDGADRYGSGPVRDAFFALANTDIIPDLENCDGFQARWNYSYPDKALESEWGAVRNIRVLVSPFGYKRENASSTGQTVYSVFFPTIESYGIVDQSGTSSQLIYTAPNVNSRLNLYASLGYKFTHATQIFKDVWLGRLDCTIYAGV